jgi:hypothetical protein
MTTLRIDVAPLGTGLHFLKKNVLVTSGKPGEASFAEWRKDARIVGYEPNPDRERLKASVKAPSADKDSGGGC